MEFFLQLVLNGIVIGSIYALVGLGFVIIYKSSSILNFAQGEFLMLGAYVCLAIFTDARGAVRRGAFALTLGLSSCSGCCIERVLLRPMIGEPVISVIMLTLGLSSVLKAVVQGDLGHRHAPVPRSLPYRPDQIGPLPVSQGYLYSVASVFVLLLLFSLFFKYTRSGIAMRATAFSQQVALSMGISVKRIFALAWSIAAVVSAVGGVLLGGIRGGVDGAFALFGLKVIPVVILGGPRLRPRRDRGRARHGDPREPGRRLPRPVFGGGVKEVAPFVALVAILTFKPYGLFGKVKIERVEGGSMRCGDFRESYARGHGDLRDAGLARLLAVFLAALAARPSSRPPTGSTS